MRLATVVLAAGGSRRFGSTKQKLLVNGEALVAKSCKLALGISPKDAYVVLGHDYEQCRELVPEGVQILCNRQWQEGLASSIRVAINGILSTNIDAVLILLGDQPLLRQQSLVMLANAAIASPENIVCSQYNNTLGVPAIFPLWVLPELAELTGDCGAKAMIERYKASVVKVPLPEAGYDVDTPEDLIHLQELQLIKSHD